MAWTVDLIFWLIFGWQIEIFLSIQQPLVANPLSVRSFVRYQLQQSKLDWWKQNGIWMLPRFQLVLIRFPFYLLIIGTQFGYFYASSMVRPHTNAFSSATTLWPLRCAFFDVSSDRRRFSGAGERNQPIQLHELTWRYYCQWSSFKTFESEAHGRPEKHFPKWPFSTNSRELTVLLLPISMSKD